MDVRRKCHNQPKVSDRLVVDAALNIRSNPSASGQDRDKGHNQPNVDD
jgi:hypothetical protein